MIVKALSNSELLAARAIVTEEISKFLTKGDIAGHDFHGNQWTGGEGGVAQSKGLPNSGLGTNPFENYRTIQDQIVARGYPHFTRDGSIGMRGWIFPDGSFTDLGGDTHAGFLRQFAPGVRSGAFLPTMAQNAGWIRKEDSADYSFSHPSTEALNALESHLTNGGFPYPGKLIHFEITNRDGSLNRDISITKSEFEDHNFDLRSTINDAKRYDLRYAAADPDLVKGDMLGHDFHGNQWVGGEGGSVEASLADQLRNTNGFTYPEPKSGYVVSEEPDKTVIVPGYATDKDIHDYMEKNPGTVGGWYHDGKTYLDSVRVYHDRGKAIEAGKQANQLAIWDVLGGKEIQLLEEAVAGVSDLTIHAGLEAGQALVQSLNQQQHAANPDLVKGDVAGHEFHGNQYTGGMYEGGGPNDLTPGRAAVNPYPIQRTEHKQPVRDFKPYTGRDHIDQYDKAQKDAVLTDLKNKGVTPELVQHNMENLYGRAMKDMTPDEQKAAIDWYQAQHEKLMAMGAEYAPKFGVPVDVMQERVVGMTAALSPQLEWDHTYYDKNGNVTRIKETNLDRTRACLDKTLAAGYPDKSVDSRALGKSFNSGGLRESAVNAISIAQGGDIDKILGGCKVRSFFDNLSNPREDGPVTIDRHAINALVSPDGRTAIGKAADKMLYGNYGRTGVGNRGAYPWFAQMISDFGQSKGLTGNQMQALLWVQWRNEHDSTYLKAKAAREKANAKP